MAQDVAIHEVGVLARGEKLAYQFRGNSRLARAAQSREPNNEAAMPVALFTLYGRDFVVRLPRIQWMSGGVRW